MRCCGSRQGADRFVAGCLLLEGAKLLGLTQKFAVGHSQQQKRIRKLNTPANWSQYDFLIWGYRANPLQALFTVVS